MKQINSNLGRNYRFHETSYKEAVRETYWLTLCSVEVVASNPETFEHLQDFYEPSLNHPNNDESPWRIYCWPGSIDDGSSDPSLTAHGVEVAVRRKRKEVYINTANRQDEAITARKLIREIFLSACEQKRFTLFHSSVLFNETDIILFVGAKESGKTTLALDGYLDHGFEFLSNDHGMVIRTEHGMALTRFPTYVNVKLGTLLKIWPRISSMVRIDETEVEREREAEDKNYKKPFYITPREFDLTSFPILPLRDGGRRVSIIFPHFQPGHSQILPLKDLKESSTLLLDELRDEWVYDTDFNPQHIKFPRRTRQEFISDSLEMSKELLARARCFVYIHSGDLGPALNSIKG